MAVKLGEDAELLATLEGEEAEEVLKSFGLWSGRDNSEGEPQTPQAGA